MKGEERNESEIFSELGQLCSSPGYAHAIACICFRDNYIKYEGEKITAKDVIQKFSMEKLSRTEISTLIGLLCKNKLDLRLPTLIELDGYINQTDALLNDIHDSMLEPIMKETFDPTGFENKDFNPLKSGNVFREAIFYGGDAAYYFQYRDLSELKYQRDNEWFIKNKNFSVSQAIDVVTAIQEIQDEKINKILAKLDRTEPDQWSFLPAYVFTIEEVATKTTMETAITRSVIESFVAPADIDMGIFSSLDEFNPKNAYPIIRLSENEFLLFQFYSLYEALYETPFFWFNADVNYKTSAMKHRGDFVEEFSLERLKHVFGRNRVFANIDICDSKNKRAGEIDVLVVFANRAIVLQAKSKKLTIAARKGNDNHLQDDFKKAIQDAYDQCYLCAKLLQDKEYKLIDSDGNELNLNRNFKEIYPFCIISEHYPALAYQARQFLSFQTTDTIMAPFVMDVFLLDVMTEMLQSPLYFLSYINRRSYYGDKILSNHELTILSYHLKQNLWISNEYSLMQLSDDICADLDLAMMSRREGVPGIDLPEGILTKYRDTIFGQIIRDIDKSDEPPIIDFGFMLLYLSGDTIETINDGILHLVKLAKRDGKHHDFTLGFSEDKYGLTIHCNDDDIAVSVPRLESHCIRRKYEHKATSWFGVCINTKNAQIRFGISQNFKWTQSDEMDVIIKDSKKPQYIKDKKKVNFSTIIKSQKKIGRNEKCLCGSGKKYKNCCLV